MSVDRFISTDAKATPWNTYFNFDTLITASSEKGEGKDMQLLDAAIAFALTIAGLATVVSIIIEVIHRVLSLRSKGLRAMLEQHFDDVIEPVIKAQVENT